VKSCKRELHIRYICNGHYDRRTGYTQLQQPMRQTLQRNTLIRTQSTFGQLLVESVDLLKLGNCLIISIPESRPFGRILSQCVATSTHICCPPNVIYGANFSRTQLTQRARRVRQSTYLPGILPNANRFSNFFHRRSKFALVALVIALAIGFYNSL